MEIERLRKVEDEARKVVDLLRKVGHDTKWRDRDQTDRVFAWYEFDDLRHALGEGEAWPPASDEEELSIPSKFDPAVPGDCG